MELIQRWWLKSSQPVEVGSLSHYLQGFSTIPTVVVWDFWTINRISSFLGDLDHLTGAHRRGGRQRSSVQDHVVDQRRERASAANKEKPWLLMGIILLSYEIFQQTIIYKDLRCIFEVWFLSPSFFWVFFCSVVEMWLWQSRNSSWYWRCALWDQATKPRHSMMMSLWAPWRMRFKALRWKGDVCLGMEFGKWNDEWCQRGSNFRFGFGKVADYVEVPMLNFFHLVFGGVVGLAFELGPKRDHGWCMAWHCRSVACVGGY